MTKENIMAKTSFQGPVRSKNNYKLYSTTASTGVEHDRTISDPAMDARRFYLEEWFLQRPGLNANIDQVSTVEVQRALNRNWEALGTNVTTALVYICFNFSRNFSNNSRCRSRSSNHYTSLRYCRNSVGRLSMGNRK
jgi:hypothetical protein